MDVLPSGRRRGVPIVLCWLACVALAVTACSAVGSGPSRARPISGAPMASIAGVTAPAGQVTIRFTDPAQVEIGLPSGRRVFIDVAQPDALTAPPRAGDVLVVTDRRAGDWDAGFAASFPGRKLVAEAGRVAFDDVAVASLRAAATEPSTPSTSSANFIAIVESSGRRIVHFGAAGQVPLTTDQLSAVHDADVAFGELADPASGIDESNRKGIKLIDQAAPRLFVPTNRSAGTLAQALAHWTACYQPAPVLDVPPGEPAAVTTLVLMGAQAGLDVTRLSVAACG